MRRGLPRLRFLVAESERSEYGLVLGFEIGVESR